MESRRPGPPGADAAVETYRNAGSDPDLCGLLALFGSTPRVVPRWKRAGDVVIGMEEDGSEIIRVPIREPVHIRKAFDLAAQVARTNVP